ncbi:MAG: pilus assembly protein CpaB [Solirubrobacterales bacterium]|jgi:Flp pilus assembly protein CpaB|nr:pilus assembly protein CpaB [Solirubrobacterales bacterium]
MNRRRRSLGFLLAAGVAAATAAAIADGYGESVARGYGELRPVVVAAADLPADEPVDPAALELRRVPVRFAPPGSLGSPAEAVGMETAARVPAGSYLLAAQLRPPSAPGKAGGELGHGRRPVEIAVNGADALLVTGEQPVGSAVDVLVTTEPSGAGTGRTYVAASGVPLLALGPGEEGAGGAAAATLGLTRRQALALIDAQSFARRVTVLPAR